MKINEDIRQSMMFSILEDDFSHLAFDFNKKHYISCSSLTLNNSIIRVCRAVLLAKLQKDGFEGTLLMVEGLIPSTGENGFLIYDSNRLTFQQANEILKLL